MTQKLQQALTAQRRMHLPNQMEGLDELTLVSERTANHLLCTVTNKWLLLNLHRRRQEKWNCVLVTQLVVVDLHGGVGQRAKDSDDGDFPDGHFTHRLQVLVPLLSIHTVLLTGGCNQLQGRREVRVSCIYNETTHTHRYTHTVHAHTYTQCAAEVMFTWTCRQRIGPARSTAVIRIYNGCKAETQSLLAHSCAACQIAAPHTLCLFRLQTTSVWS